MSLDTEEDGSKGSVTVLYASQTGTAQDVGERIGREGRRRHLHVKVAAIDDMPLTELLEQELIVFVVATTGQGDEPSNMRSFWRFLLRSDLPSDLLEHLQYTVFGLGDSSYAKFNWPAKKLHRRLADLGALSFYDKGEADDQDYLGIDTTLDKWLTGLWDCLLATFPIPEGLDIIPKETLPPPWLKIEPVPHQNGHTNGHAHPQEEDLFFTTLLRNDRATSDDHFQDVRYIEFGVDRDLDFQSGDVAELRPQNPPEQVDKFINLMGWSDPDAILRITSTSSDRPLPSHWPFQTTLRDLLTDRLDFTSVPRRSFFEFLSYFTTDELETEKLQEFSSAEGQEDLWDYANRPRRTIFEVLSEFKSAKNNIPLEYLADLFPELRPRQFSIASSSKMHPREVHLLVAIVKYRTILSIPRTGVCTSWLASLKPGTPVPITIRPGTMKLPPDDAPMILIGPGTGIAPFRSYIQERSMLQSKARILVFFGCRNKTKDHYFAQEWERCSENVQVVCAASRDQPDKVYVQDKIRQDSEQVWDLIQAGAYIYISGAADKMPAAVRKALTFVCEKHGKMDAREAEAFLENLEMQNRLQEETWS